MTPSTSSEIDRYLSKFPKEIKEKLEQIRGIVKRIAPAAEEVISYKMPSFKLHGMLVWYNAHSNHIGLYPRASGVAVFSTELSSYKTSKGAIQFPLDEPLPLDLITRIIQYRVEENLKKRK